MTNYLGKNYDGHVLMLGVDKDTKSIIQTPYPTSKVTYIPLELTEGLKQQGIKELTKQEVNTFFKQNGVALNESEV